MRTGLLQDTSAKINSYLGDSSEPAKMLNSDKVSMNMNDDKIGGMDQVAVKLNQMYGNKMTQVNMLV